MSAKKYCSKCKKEHPVSHFSKDSKAPDGLQYYCKKYHQQYVGDPDRKELNRIYKSLSNFSL
jgi:hypothetical protein